jgi:hypothetical protein
MRSTASGYKLPPPRLKSNDEISATDAAFAADAILTYARLALGCA